MNTFYYCWLDFSSKKQYSLNDSADYEVCLIGGGFVYNVTAPIAFLNNEINSEAWQDTLADNLLPENHPIPPGKYIFSIG